jgi:thiol-disulfide isomerase/thioredoxin
LAADSGLACVCLATGVAHSKPPAGEDKALPLPPAARHAARTPDVTLLDGTRFRAADAEGQVLVLYWWASWCPFCAQQSPSMDKFCARTHRTRGLRMLGLSIDRKAEDASGYLQKKGYSLSRPAWSRPAVDQALPKPRGLPVTVVRGRDGRVLAAESGQLFPEDVELFARFL